MGWLSGWSKRIKLTIDHNDIDGALSDFPILVYISASSGRSPSDISCIFDELKVNANRKKIAVTTSDGITECYVEIEKWDDANEKAWLWVKVPSIASGADTILYLYYDKDHADNTDYAGDTNSTPAKNVWDAHFMLVDHMRDGADTSNTRDSTSKNHDGVKKGDAEPALTANGQIGEAQESDGANDRIIHANHADFNVADFTTEVIFKKLGDVNYSTVVCKFTATSGWRLRYETGDTFRFLVYDTGGAIWRTSGTTTIPAGAFHYVAGMYEGGDAPDMQVDAAEYLGVNAFPAYTQNAVDMWVCADRTIPARCIDGIIDEVRFSNIKRSTAWRNATYETCWDNLLAFGSEELSEVAARKYIYIIELHDSDDKLVCILDNAYLIAYTEGINEAPTLAFSLPADNDKAVNIIKANEIWLRDYEAGTVVNKFRLSLRGDARQ